MTGKSRVQRALNTIQHPAHHASATIAALAAAMSVHCRAGGGSRPVTAFSDWVRESGRVPASVPMWLSRRRWIATVCQWARTDEGEAVLKAQHVSYPLFCAVVKVIARHANSRTGRNVAVTNTRIAEEARAVHGKCSPRSVTTIRRAILQPAGWAMEVARGAGQTAGRYNRPSLWHLLSRPVCDLSSSGSLDQEPAVEKSSPSAARRRRRNVSHTPSGSPNTAGRQEAEPAAVAGDSHTRTLAGHLAGRCLGMGGVHPGRLVAVLQASHLELTAWTAGQLLDALDAHAHTSGLSWPDRIANPAGFLAHRLRGVPARPPVLAPTPTPPRFVASPTPPVRATAEGKAAAKEFLRQAILNARRAAAA